MSHITLYRPVGLNELELIIASDWKSFPPRLSWQPIFYPVLNQQYAEQIAREWNTADAFSGYCGVVTSFEMRESYLRRYAIHNVGGEIHSELWVPAEELEDFNSHIIDGIHIISAVFGDAFVNPAQGQAGHWLKRFQQNRILMKQRNFARDILLGIATGDALGVPVEFISRATLGNKPVTGMRAFGSHHQPAGTWSDDSSLTFCLAEMLCGEYDLLNLANRFVNWKEHGYWSAHGRVFDIGLATSGAIHQLSRGGNPVLAGGRDEDSNGNGSLMRILPLVMLLKALSVEERFRRVKEVSSLTHGHIRAVIACFIYTELALQIMAGKGKHDALERTRILVNDFLRSRPDCPPAEIARFHRILLNPIGDYNVMPLDELDEDAIYSTGYVLSTLEASIWCVLKTENYRTAVLKAVNLGHDADTTGAVTGGLAALLYGAESIPPEWLDILARKSDIEDLAVRLHTQFLPAKNTER